MIYTGMLVEQWPITLGVDGAGVVTELGDKAVELGFKKGDIVCGCARLGVSNHGTAQEYHLRDALVSIKKPSNVSVAEAATLGGGFQTAAIALVEGVHIPLPEKKESEVGEWVLVFGGAGAVGRATVQFLLLAGYDVVTTCSARSKEDLESLGATTVDYKQPEDDQVEQILKITSGKLSKIIDASGNDNPVVAKKLFSGLSGEKLFATTNDWSNITDFEGGKTYEIQLGPIGAPRGEKLNKDMAKYNKIIEKLFEDGLLSTSQYDVAGEGWDEVVKAYNYHKEGKGGNKRVLVHLQDE
jgi:Zn-dependent alcohol dehydrogenase